MLGTLVKGSPTRGGFADIYSVVAREVEAALGRTLMPAEYRELCDRPRGLARAAGECARTSGPMIYKGTSVSLLLMLEGRRPAAQLASGWAASSV